MSVETMGLRVAETGDPAALAGPPRPAADGPPHVVQATVADAGWSCLGDPQLVVRPTWLHWVVPAAGGAAGLIARQSSRQRMRTRRALRALESLQMQVSRPIDEMLFDEWAAAYEDQVDAMRDGHNFVARYRALTLAPDSPYCLVVWRRDGLLVAGVVIRFDTTLSALVGRFSAVAPAHKGQELPRAIYTTLADMAAGRGMRWLSLGNDVNFYGSFCSPGLCAYKLRLGFRPVPGDLFGNTSCRTVAERMTSLDGLELPVLRFAYRRPRPPGATVDDFVDGPDQLELVSVTRPGVSNAVLESLPPHRRQVLAG